MRFCVGLSEICSMVASYGEGFRSAGHRAFTVAWKQHVFYPNARYDRCLDTYWYSGWQPRGLRRVMASVLRHLTLAWILLEALAKSDVFVLMSGDSFLPWGVDLPIMRLLGKRIVAVFTGSDIRDPRGYRRDMERLGAAEEAGPFLRYLESLPEERARQRRLVRRAERYAELILSQPGNGQLQRRPYMRMDIPVDQTGLAGGRRANAVPVVLHAPSNRDIKGTSEIVTTVQRLERQGLAMEFRLVERLPNQKVRELLREADIVIDDLYADTVGTLALEAMGAGCAVLAHYLPGYTKVPGDCPAVNVSRRTLEGELARVVRDARLREQLGAAGREYTRRHHDPEVVARAIIGWLQDSEPEYAFHPGHSA